ncbi:MAG: MATE family efflux transporter [Rhodospirillaceae bacterium TMED140]|nr:MAG: MATE family efflux transporter [Rhodospirillaceae bacterium TMED140]
MSQSMMSYRQHARAMLLLGIPLIGSHLAQAAVGLTDTVMLGWYDVEALAAGVLATSFFFMLFVLASGFSFAVMPLVASASSAGDPVQIRRVTRMGLWLSIAFAILLFPLMWWSGRILLLLGQEPVIAELAQTYLRIAGFGLLPALLVMVLKSYVAAQERAGIVLWVTIVGALGNALANWVLIFGNWGFPEMGIAGAALASTVNYSLMLAGLCFYAVRVFPEHALFQRLWRPDWEALQRVFQLGWPIGLTHLAESAMFAASAVMMGWVGTLPLAAHGIALQLASTTFMVHIGLSQAATVRAGRAFGRRDVDGLLRGGQVGFMLALAMVVLTMAAFLGMPETLISLFLDPADPDRFTIITIGVGLLAMAALFQLADGTQAMAVALLRGVHDTRVPMIQAAVSYWLVGLPTSYVLGFWTPLGAIGVWLGLVAGLSCAAVLLLRRFWWQRFWMQDMTTAGATPARSA